MRTDRWPGSAIAGGLDQLDEADGRLPVTIEMLGRTRRPVGQSRCTLLAAALHSEQDQANGAGCQDQDHNHCDDDGGHEHPFQTVDVERTGKELSYGPYNRNCNAGGAGGTALGPIVCQAKITMSRLKRGFLLSISSQLSIALWRAGQATDSVSRSREEITVETPSPRMLIPYKASAISIVRFW